jgi:hypothetical protein
MKRSDLILSKCGLSRLVPFIRGETPKERHRRRHASALAHRRQLETWCEYRGIAVRVASAGNPDTYVAEGWKWDFRVANKFAQWRPFAGKLTCKTDLRSSEVYGIKVHDYEQLLLVLEWWLNE